MSDHYKHTFTRKHPEQQRSFSRSSPAVLQGDAVYQFMDKLRHHGYEDFVEHHLPKLITIENGEPQLKYDNVRDAASNVKKVGSCFDSASELVTKNSWSHVITELQEALRAQLKPRRETAPAATGRGAKR